jgi:hypothetical protein
MERYWRVFKIENIDNIVETNQYIVQRDQDFLHINEDLPTLNTLDVLPKTWLVIEISKEDVLKALKNVLNSLNLPKEINYIKHNLN